MSESEDKKFEVPKSIGDLLGNASAQITFENMTKLCNQSDYVINNETYKRKILKPKELVALYKLQSALDEIKDPEKRMENLKHQAELCLEGVTAAKWENTDAVMMEIVLGACLLISKGFRTI